MAEYRLAVDSASALLLAAHCGQRYQVLLRVATPTATLLPLHFMQPAALGVAESREQALQGLLAQPAAAAPLRRAPG